MNYLCHRFRQWKEIMAFGVKKKLHRPPKWRSASCTPKNPLFAQKKFLRKQNPLQNCFNRLAESFFVSKLNVLLYLFFFLFSFLSEAEIEYFRSIKLSDVIRATTTLSEDDIQANVFFHLKDDPCPQPLQLNATELQPCPFLKGYDYFQVQTDKKVKKWSCHLRNVFSGRR